MREADRSTYEEDFLALRVSIDQIQYNDARLKLFCRSHDARIKSVIIWGHGARKNITVYEMTTSSYL